MLFNAKSSLYMYIKYIGLDLVGCYDISTIVAQLMLSPVGWGCRIRRLYLCRGVRPLTMRPPVGRGWWPVRRQDGSLVVERSLIRRQSGQWLATHHFGPYLVWQTVGLGPIRSIGWSCQALAPIYFILTVLLNLHLQHVPNPYLLVARRRWLRVNCVDNRNPTRAENLKLATARKPTLNSSILVAYPLSQPRRMGYPLGSFPTQVGLRGGGGAQDQWKIYSI